MNKTSKKADTQDSHDIVRLSHLIGCLIYCVSEFEKLNKMHEADQIIEMIKALNKNPVLH